MKENIFPRWKNIFQYKSLSLKPGRNYIWGIWGIAMFWNWSAPKYTSWAWLEFPSSEEIYSCTDRSQIVVSYNMVTRYLVFSKLKNIYWENNVVEHLNMNQDIVLSYSLFIHGSIFN